MSRTDDRQQTTECLDIAIDRAVREMLDVEPPAGLRGRVMDRLESPRRGMSWTWLVAPVAAAAVILLAVLAPWRHAAQPVSPLAPAIARVEPNPNVRPPDTPTPRLSPGTIANPPPGVTPAGQRRSPPRVQEQIDAAVVDAGEATNQIEPLAPIAPITVAGTHPEDIAPKQIAISPLAPIAELQIAPLSPPERRN